MGGTAIELAGVDEDLRHRPVAVDVQDAEPDGLGLGSVVAMIAVSGVCLLLAVLPAAVALNAAALPEGWAAAGLGGFAGVIFSFKLAAGAWGMMARLWSAYPAPVIGDTA